MRFDDRLDTLLNRPAPDVAAKSALWAQLADVVAQGEAGLEASQKERAFARLRDWRASVPEARRFAAATALSHLPMNKGMIQFFGEEQPRIAAPVIARAHLKDGDWLDIIPHWPATSRALLRQRRDLPAEVDRLLAAYGPSNLTLPDHAEARERQAEPIQIRDLVARIEAYRRDNRPARPVAPPTNFQTFRFESDHEGLIDWVEGVQRGPLIGLSLAEMARPGGGGVDGHAAGACRQRAAFTDARLLVAGAGDASGQWLISADPLFNSEDGRFAGYRGVGRRFGPSEPQASTLLGGGLKPDSLRQLVHELRTPLNAVRGFGEMIEGRMLGPVAQPYRDKAAAIVRDATKLLGVIDDLDTAARLETDSLPPSRAGTTDLVAVLKDVASDLHPWTDERAIRLRVAIGKSLPLVQIDVGDAARLVHRLLSAAVGTAGTGETIAVRLEATGSGVALMVDRPERLKGCTTEQLMDSTAAPAIGEGDQPPLGLGFTLRLIDGLVNRLGGMLEITDTRFGLILAGVQDSAVGEQEQG